MTKYFSDPSPDSAELADLVTRRDEVIKETARITRNGELPPDSKTQLLGMEFEKLTDEINALRLRGGLNPEQRAGRSTLLGDMLAALRNGSANLKDVDRRNFTITNAGATILNPSSIQRFFEELKAGNPLSQLGAQMINASENYTQFPYEATGATVSWIADGGSVSEDTTAAIASRKIDFKHAAILLKAHNHWLEDSDIAGVGLGRAVLTEMMINAANEAIVKVALTGASGSNQPVGLDNLTSAGVQTVDGGGAVLANYAKIIDAVVKLLRVNVQFDRIGGIISPEIWGQLAKLQDTQTATLVIPDQLKMLPMYVTSAALDTYNTNTRTRAYFSDWSSCMMAVNGGPFVRLLSERYAEDFVTGFLLSMRVDIQFVRRTSFCILTDVLNS